MVNFSLKQNLIISTVVYLILIIGLSLFSLNKLSQVQSLAVEKQNNAVKLQQETANLQVLLLQQIKISSASLAVDDEQKLSEIRRDYGVLKNDFNRQLQRFSQYKLSSQTQSVIQKLSSAANSFANSAESLFSNTSRTFALYQELDEKLLSFEQQADELGALLLDIAYADNGEDAERIEGMTNQLDTTLYTIIGIGREIYNAQKQETLTHLEETLSFALKDFAIKMDYLFRNLDPNMHSDAITNVGEQKEKAFALLTAQTGLIAIRSNLIKASTKQKSLHQTSEAQVNTALQFAERVKADAENAMQNIQTAVGNTVNDAYSTGIIALVISLLVAAITYWLTMQAIIRPLQGMGKVVSAIANGDLTRSLRIRVDDEMGKLSADINKMTDSLRTLVTLIRDTSSQLSSAVEYANDDTHKLSQQLRKSVHLVESSKMNAQAVELQATDVADKLEVFSNHMQDTNNEVVESRKNSQHTKQLVEQLNQQACHSGERINQLKLRSSEIDNIVETIEKIAEQTNLLALNAAIESARAGEQGRGFAVVADEVRELASRTQNSTIQIQKIIAEIQNDIDSSFNSMQTGIKISNQVCSSIETLDKSMQTINHEITQTRQEFSSAQSSISEQRAAISEMTRAVSQIADISNTNLNSAEQTLEQSRKINSLTEDLKKVIARFITESG
ncbi:methyl-accepting chemotaxis protein [Catenovulum sediminis]|uniref:Methyl-accepting chemotaxis protein n=1 Tax=Catenovulum sediminis TaxID=1740262 RepID=A0ABV1RBZ7_9ALTE|nr:methyl-accepting chemotaxis protein [Catenovulum sediminis]